MVSPPPIHTPKLDTTKCKAKAEHFGTLLACTRWQAFSAAGESDWSLPSEVGLRFTIVASWRLVVSVSSL